MNKTSTERLTLIPAPTARRRFVVRTIKLALVVTSTVGVGNYSELIIPKAIASGQQYLSLLMWIVPILASLTIQPKMRPRITTDVIAAIAFFGLAAVSVSWSDLAAESIMKSFALIITMFGALRIALFLSIQSIIQCVIVGLTIQCVASMFLVIFVPTIGIVQAWMHNGQWSGIFESKQSLGTVGAFLIFFSGYRFLGGGRRWQFLLTFALAVICTIGSGSRGGGAAALAAILILYLTQRSQWLTALFAFSPAIMLVTAYALIGHLYVVDRPYLLVFDERIDLTERTFIWHHALERFDQKAFFGFGINGFWSDPWISNAFKREHGWVLDNFHSGYLTILIELGIVGAFLFATWFVFYGVRVAFTPRSSAVSNTDLQLIVCYTTMIFFFDFTETFFLRSTNVISVLMLIFYFKSTLRSVGKPIHSPTTGRFPYGPDAMRVPGQITGHVAGL